MSPDTLPNLFAILLITGLVLAGTMIPWYRLTDRRPDGSWADMAAFGAALVDLETASDAERAAVEAEADRLGLTGKARRQFYAGLPESDAWLAANAAVLDTRARISAPQEALVRKAIRNIQEVHRDRQH